MIERLFIANRGEIAVRVIRAARELGIETVVAVSEPDRHSYAASLADEVAVVGPAAAARSYLQAAAVIAAARASGADAVHPGYGFLSENAAFAHDVSVAGLTWVGPAADTIRLMGDKAAAREAARAQGVPTVAGTVGTLGPDDDVEAVAAELGYPLMIKAAAGGGGRGIRVVRGPDQLKGELSAACAEAEAAFGSGAVYLEQFIERARHVEVQVLGDGETVVHLYDRDCSVQRRQQKLIEEGPATGLPAAARQEMLDSAVRLAGACGYRGVGTVEFLYDSARERACFIEMNTRLQVEHAVTEMITGIDLVREQLRIAGGERLGFAQEDVSVRGHAVEVRINAEDPSMGFMPSPGEVVSLTWPGGPGVRVDSGVVRGSVIQPYYDSLVAKVIVHDATREAATARALRALDELQVQGIKTTRPFVRRVLADAAFAQGTHHTRYLADRPDLLADLGDC